MGVVGIEYSLDLPKKSIQLLIRVNQSRAISVPTVLKEKTEATMRDLFRKKRASENNVIVSVSELIDKASNPESGWGRFYYGNVSKLAQLIKADEIIEVGVAYAGHANYILQNDPEIKYLGVDPYEFGYDPNDAFCSDVEGHLGLKGQQAMEELFQGVSLSLEKYESRARIFRMKSIIFANSLQNESQGLVFLDDNHTYQYVSKELNAWWPKIKKRGVLCGDDYWMTDVSKAVNHFVKANNLQLHFIGKNDYKTWFIQKD